MKAGWEYRKLGDVCDIIGGGTPSKNNELFYLNGTIPWATVRDMKSNIATTVGLGKVCLLAHDTAINQDLKGIIPKNTSVLSVGYLFQWFKNIAHIIQEEGTGATVQGVKLPFIKSLIIPISPIIKQQRIVTILDEAFDGIATAKANAENKLTRKAPRVIVYEGSNKLKTKTDKLFVRKQHEDKKCFKAKPNQQVSAL